MNPKQIEMIELLRSYWYDHLESDDDFDDTSDYLQSLKDVLSTKEINELENLIQEYACKCEENAFYAAFEIANTLNKII